MLRCGRAGGGASEWVSKGGRASGTAWAGEGVSVRRCVGAREGRLKEACIGRTAVGPYDQLTTAERSRIDLMVTATLLGTSRWIGQVGRPPSSSQMPGDLHPPNPHLSYIIPPNNTETASSQDEEDAVGHPYIAQIWLRELRDLKVMGVSHSDALGREQSDEENNLQHADRTALAHALHTLYIEDSLGSFVWQFQLYD